MATAIFAPIGGGGGDAPLLGDGKPSFRKERGLRSSPLQKESVVEEGLPHGFQREKREKITGGKSKREKKRPVFFGVMPTDHLGRASLTSPQ